MRDQPNIESRASSSRGTALFGARCEKSTGQPFRRSCQSTFDLWTVWQLEVLLEYWDILFYVQQQLTAPGRGEKLPSHKVSPRHPLDRLGLCGLSGLGKMPEKKLNKRNPHSETESWLTKSHFTLE